MSLQQSTSKVAIVAGLIGSAASLSSFGGKFGEWTSNPEIRWHDPSTVRGRFELSDERREALLDVLSDEGLPIDERARALRSLLRAINPTGFKFVVPIASRLGDFPELRQDLIDDVGAAYLDYPAIPGRAELAFGLLETIGRDPSYRGGILNFSGVYDLSPQSVSWKRVQSYIEDTTIEAFHRRLLFNQYCNMYRDNAGLALDPAWRDRVLRSFIDSDPGGVGYAITCIGSRANLDWYLEHRAFSTRHDSVPDSLFDIPDFAHLEQRGVLTHAHADALFVQLIVDPRPWTPYRTSLAREFAQSRPEQALAEINRRCQPDSGSIPEGVVHLIELLSKRTQFGEHVCSALERTALDTASTPESRSLAVVTLARVGWLEETGIDLPALARDEGMSLAALHASLLLRDRDLLADAIAALPQQSDTWFAEGMNLLGSIQLAETERRSVIAALTTNLFDDGLSHNRMRAVLDGFRKFGKQGDGEQLLAFAVRGDSLEWGHPGRNNWAYSLGEALEIMEDLGGPSAVSVLVRLENALDESRILRQAHERGDARGTYGLWLTQDYFSVADRRPSIEAFADGLDAAASSTPERANEYRTTAQTLRQALDLGITQPFRLSPRSLRRIVETRLGNDIDPSSPQVLILTGRDDWNGALHQNGRVFVDDLIGEGCTVWFYEIAADRPVAGYPMLAPVQTWTGAVDDLRQLWSRHIWTSDPGCALDLISLDAHANASFMSWSLLEQTPLLSESDRVLDASDVTLIAESGIRGFCRPGRTTVLAAGCNTAAEPEKGATGNVLETIRRGFGDTVAPGGILGPDGYLRRKYISFDRESRRLNGLKFPGANVRAR